MNDTITSETSYAKVMNALQGKPNSRVPFGMLLSLYGKNYVKESIDTYYANPEVYFKGQTQIIHKFNPDIISTPFVLAYDGKVFGSELKHFKNSPPQIRKPACNDYRDINKIKTPDLTNPCQQYILETANLLSSKYKNDKLIAGLMLSNIDMPALIMGIEGWLDTLLFHEENANELLKKTTDYFVAFANEMFRRGIDVLVIPNMFSNPSIITNAIMDNITLEFLINGLRKVNGPVIIHHGGARLGHFLQYYTNLPNVIGFAIDSSDDFHSSRKRIGNKLLLGNIDIKIISNKTPAIIERHTRSILEEQKQDRNYIFYNANADIMLETPEENIMAVCNTINSFELQN